MLLTTEVYLQSCGTCQQTFNCADGCACPDDGFYCTSTCCSSSVCVSKSVCDGKGDSLAWWVILIICVAGVIVILLGIMIIALCCGICECILCCCK